MGRRDLWLACAMTLFLVLFEGFTLHTPYGPYFRDANNDGWLLGMLRPAVVFGVICVQGVWFWAAFASTPAWRWLYGALFAFMVFLEYGYVRATGGFLSGHDFEIAASARMHWVAMAAHFVNWTALIPTGVFAALLAVAGRGARPRGNVSRFLAATAITLAVHSVYAASIYAHQDEEAGLRVELGPPLVSSQWFARSVTMFVWNRGATAYFHMRYGGRMAVAPEPSAAPTRHIVLVVDESVRADHLSVNGYKRSTTPWLETLQQEGRLSNWGAAASATPTSNDSVLALLTGVQVLPDRERRTMTWPTAFQFAKAMGYETHLYDGGQRQLRFGFDSADLRFIDDWGTRDRFGNDADTDFRIAEEVARLLAGPKGQFVVVLKRGDHFPYEGNYPDSQSRWTPGNVKLPGADLNDGWFGTTYDNGLLYNVDAFFRILLRDPAAADRSVVLYTSDHGQQLLDQRPQGLTREVLWGEVAVPMIMFGGGRPAVDTAFKAGHANVMATLLDLMNVPAATRQLSYATSLLRGGAAMAHVRTVFAGDFYGLGPYAVQDFDELERRHGTGARR